MPANDDNKRSQSTVGEWLKVMLGEIERKRTEQEEAERELERRGQRPQGKQDKDDMATDSGE